MKTFKIIILTLIASCFFYSCTSYEKFKYITEEFEVPSKLYKANFNQTWQAIIELIKKLDIEVQNQEAGVIKTKWMDNTAEVNFSDAFSKSDTVKAAKYKLILNIVKGYRGSREVSKVTVYKRQLIEQDFLQGWKEVPTDSIQEKVFLYRLERLISIDNKLREIDKLKEKQIIDNF
jgi:hypothetical protein